MIVIEEKRPHRELGSILNTAGTKWEFIAKARVNGQTITERNHQGSEGILAG